MAQQLRALVLVDDPGLVPSTHIVARNDQSFHSRGSDALFCPEQAPGLHVRINICRQDTNTHKINKPKNKF